MRFLLFLILCPILLLAPDNALASGENYIVRRDYLNAAGTEYVDVVEYFDGLGRSVETVQRGITPSGQSLVTVREYDSQSRLAREWQPVVSPKTDFTDPSEVAALATATYGHGHAYTSTEYHRSPIEEVYAVTRPSNQQFGKAVTTERYVNDQTSQFKCYDFRVRENSLTNLRLFPTGSLKATKMTDEDGHVSIEFRDRKNRLRVQRLTVSDGNYADTYYVYDNYDELRYVIPPMASEQLASSSSVGKEWTVSDKEISDWCYYYEYDIFGHVTVKKFPGSEKTVYRYNGNISSETWDNGGEQRKYTYQYDGMNRLVSAKYDGTGKYGTEYRYDKNSNPTHIKRQGFIYSYNGNPLYGDIDDLTISYTGNHIKQVSDANNGLGHYGGLDFSKIAYGSDGDYRYNANGSLSYDPDRGISISYDRHNLPQLIKFDSGGEITYRNDGEGRRMEVTHRISSASASLAGKPVPSAAYKTVLKRKYIDHFVYRNDTLEYILTPTGYIDRDGNYYHYQKDSRGSVRTVLDGAGLVVERNDYYPYGMLMDGVSKSVQPYKFGGKELDRIGGINHYDFHARQLQLPIPHFYQQDPYADKYPHLSPYLYCTANPLRYVDPSGKVLNFAEGTTPEFKINFYKALIFMSVRGTSDNILKIMLSPNVYYISNDITGIFNRFEGRSKTIFWNPLKGLKTTDGKYLSPATMLDHEAQHCVNYDENKKKYIKDLNTKLDNTINKDYDNEEDKNVIQKRERQTAIKHGDIKDGDFSRKNHRGEPFDTKSPTTNVYFDINELFM